MAHNPSHRPFRFSQPERSGSDGQSRRQRENAAFLNAIESLRPELVGTTEPFEQNLFPGEQPTQGLSNEVPGILRPGKTTSIINGLLGSGIKDLQKLGLQTAVNEARQQDISGSQVRTSQLKRFNDQRDGERLAQVLGAEPFNASKGIQNLARIKGFGKEALTIAQKKPEGVDLSKPQRMRINGKVQLVQLPKNGKVTPENIHILSDKISSAPSPTQQRDFDQDQLKYNKVERAEKEYRALLEESGTEILDGDAKSKLSGAYQHLLLQIKELENLGVLNGPDLEVIEGVITNPIDYTSNISASIRAINPFSDSTAISPLTGQLDLLRNNLNNAKAARQAVFDGEELPELITEGSKNKDIKVIDRTQNNVQQIQQNRTQGLPPGFVIDQPQGAQQPINRTDVPPQAPQFNQLNNNIDRFRQ